MDLATTYFAPTLVILLITISGVYALLKKWINAAFFTLSGVFLALMELVSKALTGVTISETHWTLNQEHPEIGNLLNVLLGVLFLLIVVHLAKIMIAKMLDKD